MLFSRSCLGLAAAKEAAKLNKAAKVSLRSQSSIREVVRDEYQVACFDFVTPTFHGTKWGLGGKSEFSTVR